MNWSERKIKNIQYFKKITPHNNNGGKFLRNLKEKKNCPVNELMKDLFFILNEFFKNFSIHLKLFRIFINFLKSHLRVLY